MFLFFLHDLHLDGVVGLLSVFCSDGQGGVKVLFLDIVVGMQSRKVL